MGFRGGDREDGFCGWCSHGPGVEVDRVVVIYRMKLLAHVLVVYSSSRREMRENGGAGLRPWALTIESVRCTYFHPAAH